MLWCLANGKYLAVILHLDKWVSYTTSNNIVWKTLKTGDTKLICAWNTGNYQQHQPDNISISHAGAQLSAVVYVETALPTLPTLCGELQQCCV